MRGHLGVVVLEEPLDRVQRRQRRLGPAREPAARPLAEEAYDRLEGAQRVALERERERVDGRRQPVRVGERRAPAPERAAALDERRRRVAPRQLGRAPPARGRSPRGRVDRRALPAVAAPERVERRLPLRQVQERAPRQRSVLRGKLALLAEDPPQARGRQRVGVARPRDPMQGRAAPRRRPPRARRRRERGRAFEVPRRGRRRGPRLGCRGLGRREIPPQRRRTDRLAAPRDGQVEEQ